MKNINEAIRDSFGRDVLSIIFSNGNFVYRNILYDAYGGMLEWQDAWRSTDDMRISALDEIGRSFSKKMRAGEA